MKVLFDREDLFTPYLKIEHFPTVNSIWTEQIPTVIGKSMSAIKTVGKSSFMFRAFHHISLIHNSA